MKSYFIPFLLALFIVMTLTPGTALAQQQPVYQDTEYIQDYSIKYILESEKKPTLMKVEADRNGVIQIFTTAGLLRLHAGAFLYPGTLVPDVYYLPFKDKNIKGLTKYKDHFVYLEEEAVLSNAWAGELFIKHSLPESNVLAGGNDFDFLLANGTSLQYIKGDEILWEGKNTDAVLDITFDEKTNTFYLLSATSLTSFSPKNNRLKEEYSGENFTCFALFNNDLYIGTSKGYWVVNTNNFKEKGSIHNKLPWNELTTIEVIDGQLWFGSKKGAFMLKEDGKFNYYASQRWLPSDHVVDIAKGPENSVLILTDLGLSKIVFEEMTLAKKAEYYDKVQRARHNRHGFNSILGDMDISGNVDTGTLDDSDNDGLWTAMYLAGEVFRYAVTQSEDALQNCRESMEAMERLFSISPVKGFPSRSFMRTGYKYDSEPWRRTSDPEWDWKSTTSSDEIIGHIFVYGVMAELIGDPDLEKRAIVLIDSVMQHIVDHDFYLVDWNGEPTTWGKWNPEYVNARPKMVGDRKLNSSNMIAMLQTAYYFTKKEIYKEKAFELMNEHGYLENLMRPLNEIGQAPEDADDWSKMLSKEWNHSDDEMYFLGYWGLYRYAFNDTLKAQYKEAIIDHWEYERPEKEVAWNIFTAITDTDEFDLDESVWFLQEYPLDMISWDVENSSRKDITLIEPNFRGQTTEEVLPPDELEVRRHNRNRFVLDNGGGGHSEYPPGDIWLLPYWMGRYLGVISEPE